MASLETNFAGIKSPNPFWLASGPPTNTGYQVMKASSVFLVSDWALMKAWMIEVLSKFTKYLRIGLILCL